MSRIQIEINTAFLLSKEFFWRLARMYGWVDLLYLVEDDKKFYQDIYQNDNI